MVSFLFCSKSTRCFSRDVVNTVPYKIRRGGACRYPANPPLDNIFIRYIILSVWASKNGTYY